jgi:isoquinoline 1-oxidoreductase alpha subunit
MRNEFTRAEPRRLPWLQLRPGEGRYGPPSLGVLCEVSPPTRLRRVPVRPPTRGPMKYTLRVNGKSTTVDAPPDMPLLWVLRDLLDLKGAKYGCGIGQCGACTVHRNGVPTRSCLLPISAAQGASITTIEGLSADGSHPLQRAWQELDVPQCGYCQAGQIMSAAVLLAKTPRPTDGQIDAAMNGNLCRCATYLRIREAIHKAAGATAAQLTPAGTPRGEE